MHSDFQYILHTLFSSSSFSAFPLLSPNVSFPFHPTALFILFLQSKDSGPYDVLTFPNPCFPIVFTSSTLQFNVQSNWGFIIQDFQFKTLRIRLQKPARLHRFRTYADVKQRHIMKACTMRRNPRVSTGLL